jgi:DNA-binding MarR family transcriptional regulator
MAKRPATETADALEIEADVLELLRLLPALFRGLRHGGPDLPELEPLKQAFLEAGLGKRHARVMLALASTRPVSVGELASRLALTPATTSLLVGELHRAGFVERHEDDNDHRRTIISLPDHLRQPMEQFANLRLEPLRRALTQLEPEARANLIEGLRVLTSEAEAAAGGPTP